MANHVNTFECIYCRKIGEPDAFSQEHVIPQAFGTFGPETPTLTREVCAECNNFFGRKLELYLGRGSQEAVERFKHGLKPLHKLSEVQRKRISLTFAGQGEFKGAKLLLTHAPGSDQPLVEPATQAGFMRKGNTEREFFELGELSGMQSFDKSLYDLREETGVVYFAKSEAEETALLEQFARLGIKFTAKNSVRDPFSSDKVLVKAISNIDEVVQRTIAKIVFNYLAWQMGATYALRADFDPCRRFIRYGERPSFRVVTPSGDPILHNDTAQLRQTTAHLIHIETQKALFRLAGRVSLFNQIAYLVMLAPHMSGIGIRIAKGHLFDFDSESISPLVGVPKAIQIARRLPRGM